MKVRLAFILHLAAFILAFSARRDETWANDNPDRGVPKKEVGFRDG
jgi:hypothetical protein